MCHKTIRLGLAVLYTVILRNMVHSQSLNTKLFKDFSLEINCAGNKGQPGFQATFVQVCVKDRSKSHCSNDDEDSSDDDSNEDSDDLFHVFVKLIGREICQNKTPAIIQFFNETKPLFVNVGTISDMRVPGLPTKAEDDDMRATIDRLRVGVAVGTILGFVAGVMVTGLLILLYTKKMQRLKNSSYSSQVDTQRKTQLHGEKAEYQYDNAHYTYCDVNDEICQRPIEPSSKSQNSEESHKYQDCNLNTYNHLNESNSNNAIRHEEYDHIRNARADSLPSDGEYRMLEPANSKQEVGILPIEKPTCDMSKPSDDNYFELENVKCQATNPDAYFVLEKDS